MRWVSLWDGSQWPLPPPRDLTWGNRRALLIQTLGATPPEPTDPGHPSQCPQGCLSFHCCPDLQSSDGLLLFLGRVLCSVTQGLEKLQVLNGKENWREP